MKIIYIASPYTLGDVADNVAVQIEAAHKIMDAGHCPVVPLLSHYLHIHRRRPYKDWVTMDLALIPRMDIILRLPGKSSGADGEVDAAKKFGIPVAFGWEELWTLLQNTQIGERDRMQKGEPQVLAWRKCAKAWRKVADDMYDADPGLAQRAIARAETFEYCANSLEEAANVQVDKPSLPS